MNDRIKFPIDNKPDRNTVANDARIPSKFDNRYTIIEPIGSGGMGEVYRAYDPILDRGVALKVLSLKKQKLVNAEKSKARLIREAQALAKLSHPNVVAVHDVGTFNDDVYISMEFVEGITLREWIAEHQDGTGTAARGPNLYKEVIKILTAAAQGLDAAHKAGLIHRDFKPRNVIVGNDGRVRVLDFGLARAIDSVVDDSENQQSAAPKLVAVTSKNNFNLLDIPLTQTGGILGSPLYMSPEQHIGWDVDERTDQFSFFVVLYEALYGERPFLGRSVEELRNNVVRCRISSPPKNSDVPPWLREIVLRGLSKNPLERYDSMGEVLRVLNQDFDEVEWKVRHSRFRNLLVFVFFALAVIIPCGIWYAASLRTLTLCKSSRGILAGVWDEDTKNAIQKAFLSTEEPYAFGTWKRVEKNLDDYLAGWRRMRNTICEARHIDESISENNFDNRMYCLDKRIKEFGALTKLFVSPSPGVIQKAVEASSSLDSVLSCTEDKPFSPSFSLVNRVVDAKIESIQSKLDYLKALHKTGQYRLALKNSEETVRDVKDVTYRPIAAEVLYLHGLLLEKCGYYKRSETTLNEVVRIAGEIKSPMLSAKAMVWLVWIVGYQLARPKEGLVFAQNAGAMLGVAGGDDSIEALLNSNLGTIHYRMVEYDKALGYFRNSLSIIKRNNSHQQSRWARVTNNVGSTYLMMGEYQKSLEYFRDALVHQENTIGPEHPDVSATLNNIGFSYWRLKDYKLALEFYRKSLDIRKKVFGDDHPLVASVLNNLGLVHFDLNEFDKSLRYFHRCLDIWEKSFGNEHPFLSGPLSGLGAVYVKFDKPRLALKPLRRVVDLCEKLACDPFSLGLGYFSLAKALVAVGGDKSQAMNLAQKAKSVYSSVPDLHGEFDEVSSWLRRFD